MSKPDLNAFSHAFGVTLERNHKLKLKKWGDKERERERKRHTHARFATHSHFPPWSSDATRKQAGLKNVRATLGIADSFLVQQS